MGNNINTTVNLPHKQKLYPQTPPMPTMKEVEKEYIDQVMKAVNGNKTKAAEVLGFTIKTLYNKLHKYRMFHDYSGQEKLTKS